MKSVIEQIKSINKEIQNINARLEKITEKENTVTIDSVQASSREYPYTQHNVKIEGVWIPKNKHLKNKYRKMLKSKEYKLDKLKLKLEYELNYIDDPEIREITRQKYIDGKTWLQIMFAMNYKSESTAKMKIKRFLKKNQKCDDCDDGT